MLTLLLLQWHMHSLFDADSTVGKLVDEYVLKSVEVNSMHDTDDESSSQSGLETSVQDDWVTNYASVVNGYCREPP